VGDSGGIWNLTLKVDMRNSEKLSLLGLWSYFKEKPRLGTDLTRWKRR
jgi:hypothetical protein